MRLREAKNDSPRVEGMENFSEAALEEIATWFSEDEKVDLES